LKFGVHRVFSIICSVCDPEGPVSIPVHPLSFSAALPSEFLISRVMVVLFSLLSLSTCHFFFLPSYFYPALYGALLPLFPRFFPLRGIFLIMHSYFFSYLLGFSVALTVFFFQSTHSVLVFMSPFLLSCFSLPSFFFPRNPTIFFLEDAFF